MRPHLPALLLPLLALVGCSGGPADMGELSIEATDAPFAHDLVLKAEVRVKEVNIRSADGHGWYTVVSGAPITLDLITLTNGVTELLGRVGLRVGSYDELRLVIDDARLELVNGDVFSTGLGNMKMSSLPTSGLKVKMAPAIRVESSLTTHVLLDFDLTQTFHPVPSSKPLAATSFKLQPVIRAVDVSSSGALEGTIQEDDGTGQLVGVPAATVFVMPPGELDTAQAVGSTGTAGDGSYTVLGVTPGTYDVLAVHGALSGTKPGVAVSAGQFVVVDLQVQ